MTAQAPTSSPARNPAIDQFRGLAIFGMVVINFLADFRAVPGWLKHAPDVGFTVADLVAPMFIFAIALTYRASAKRRLARTGSISTVRHFATRYLAIFGMGAFLSHGESALQISRTGHEWGVLQAIGVAGVVTLFFIFLDGRWRALAGLTMLLAYQICLDQAGLPAVMDWPHGGMLGAMSWSAMLLLATVLTGGMEQVGPGWLRWGLAMAVLAAGLGLSVWFPISKNRVSPAYDLTALGASGLLYLICLQISSAGRKWLSILEPWGKNPLLLYGLHLILLGVFVLPGIPGWHEDAPVWLIAVQGVWLLFMVGWTAKTLSDRNILLVV